MTEQHPPATPAPRRRRPASSTTRSSPTPTPPTAPSPLRSRPACRAWPGPGGSVGPWRSSATRPASRSTPTSGRRSSPRWTRRAGSCSWPPRPRRSRTGSARRSSTAWRPRASTGSRSCSPTGPWTWDEDRRRLHTDSTALHPSAAGPLSCPPPWVDLSWARGSTDLTLRNPRFRTQVAELVAPVRELDLEQLLAEDERQRRRTSRVVRAAVGALATLLVLSVGAAALAWVNQRQADTARATAQEAAVVAEEQRALAEEQARVARGRELAARALEHRRGGCRRRRSRRSDPTLALLLAAQAQTLGDTDAARAALLTLASGVGRDAGIVLAPAPLPSGLDPGRRHLPLRPGRPGRGPAG